VSLSSNILILVAILYVSMLFLVAYLADRRAGDGARGWLASPLVYTLSLSIYTTAWTFYGAVGSAVRNGLEFLAIYLGPTLVFVGWWLLLRKLVRIGRTQRITSIADLISSRFGKSTALAVVVTVLAVLASTPYIALQLQSVAFSFAVFAGDNGGIMDNVPVTALWLAVGLAAFTILFGTRSVDSNERHHGVVMAIAVEAVVKLVALLAVGIFVVWGLADGIGDIVSRIDTADIVVESASGRRWVALFFLSAAAIICLPRMFQVTVVENTEESHMATAGWAFPLYLFLMSLFVLPIAVVGLAEMPAGSNPDMFVLTLPLAHDAHILAMLAFLGGFSSATSMVIVAAIALATMVSNHIVMPIWLWSRADRANFTGDVRGVLILARRFSIAGILALGYLYFVFTSGTGGLASIGLIAFTGVAQVLPALLGGLFWRGATMRGALCAILIGAFLWLYTLFLPSFEGAFILSQATLEQGPFGIALLRPQALFGVSFEDPLVHAVFWSLGINTLVFLLVSIATIPSPLERLQAVQFVNVFRHSSAQSSWSSTDVRVEDLLIMAQRIMGNETALGFFRDQAVAQGKSGALPDPTQDFVDNLERNLAGSVGAATAHAMIGQTTGVAGLSVDDLIRMAGETAQIMEHSAQLEAKSAEQVRTARQLREANEKLTELSVQKDGFLSQISHELRTPMTSIRSFSEILRESDDLTPDQVRRYSSVIQEESLRLTRLLDEILDLSFLESGRAPLKFEEGKLETLLDRAVGPDLTGIAVIRDRAAEDVTLRTDLDRLSQVFINLVSNARKYCAAEVPELTIQVKTRADRVTIDFVDNGAGIPEAHRAIIFEKFSRLSDAASAGSAGLGLAICREIMRNLGGDIDYIPGKGGAAFRVRLPLAPK